MLKFTINAMDIRLIGLKSKKTSDFVGFSIDLRGGRGILST